MLSGSIETGSRIKLGRAHSLPANAINIAPVADCGTDKLRCENAGTKVQFYGTASYDPDGTISSYDWEFGDGETGTGAAPEHTYASYRWNGTAYDPYTSTSLSLIKAGSRTRHRNS